MTNPQNDEYNPSQIQVPCLKQQTVKLAVGQTPKKT